MSHSGNRERELVASEKADLMRSMVGGVAADDSGGGGDVGDGGLLEGLRSETRDDQQLPSRFDSLLGRPRRRLIWLCKGQREVQEIIEMRFREESEESSSFCDYSGQYRIRRLFLACLALSCACQQNINRQDKTRQDSAFGQPPFLKRLQLLASVYIAGLRPRLLAFDQIRLELLEFDLDCWNSI